MTEILQAISYLVGIGGLIVGFAGWLRNSKGDTAEQARWMGGIDQMLKTISDKLDKLDGIPGRVKAVEDRVGALEAKLCKHLDDNGR